MTTAPLRPGTAAPATPPVLDHARFGSAAAVVAGEEVLTHAELAERVRQRAAAWGPERRLVLVEATSTLDGLTAYLAALQHGHVALVVPAERPDQRSAMIAAYDPDIVCVEGADDTVRRASSAHDLHPDLALLLSTSGTTGSAKLVRLSRRNVASNAASIAHYLALRPTDRAITSLPLHYCYGLSVLHSHLVVGGSVVLTGLSVVDECFWDLFARSGATSFAGVPHTFDLLETSGFADRDLPRLRQVTQAGGRLASGSVRRWAEAGQRRGWDLVVMYGQTEATARMAWLPPGLAASRPEAIGQAIPGGSLRLDQDADDRDGVGELVYSGPNVMMGYATTPADLGRGSDVDELRTGDLARERDGLFEIVGRRNRIGKVFGLRIDLDHVEQLVRSGAHRQACVVATDRGVHVFQPHGRTAGQARDLVADSCGLPTSAVHTHVLAEMPLTPNGKPDYRGLSALAGDASGAVAPDDDLATAYARVLGRPDVTPDDTFVGLGGDSLSYVELATRLEALLPAGLPAGWHTMPIRELAPASGVLATTGAQGPAPTTGVRLDTTILLRALAILAVVVTHVDLVHVYGGAHLLLVLAGFNFARFTLAVADPAARLGNGLATLARLIVPATLWIAGVGLLLGTYELTTALYLREWVSGPEWDRQWEFWFIETWVWVTVAALAITCAPRLRDLERRWPFAFALVLLGATALLRFLTIEVEAGPTQRYRTAFVAFFFVLGWLGARATTHRRRLLVSALSVAVVAGYFDSPAREALVVGGFLLVVWVPHVRVPAMLARAAGAVAAASLFIYLTHWQVYPWLEAAGHPLTAIVASVAVGLVFAALVRPAQRTVTRAVRGPR